MSTCTKEEKLFLEGAAIINACVAALSSERRQEIYRVMASDFGSALDIIEAELKLYKQGAIQHLQKPDWGYGATLV